jgi:hypothetical protein
MMELYPSQLTALTLAGTVALPSPYPAYGSVSLVVVGDDVDLEVLVKILQVVSPRRSIVRLIRPEDIRAIRGNPDGTIGAGPESWPILDLRRLRADLDRRAEDLRARVGTGPLAESLWYRAAIVYVPESTPVLHRNEVGVTAAVSAEEVGFGDLRSRCCHIADPLQDEAFSGRCCRPSAPLDSSAAGHCCHIAHRPLASALWAGEEPG